MTPVILVQRIWNAAPGVGTMLAVARFWWRSPCMRSCRATWNMRRWYSTGSVVIPPHVGTFALGDNLT